MAHRARLGLALVLSALAPLVGAACAENPGSGGVIDGGSTPTPDAGASALDDAATSSTAADAAEPGDGATTSSTADAALDGGPVDPDGDVPGPDGALIATDAAPVARDGGSYPVTPPMATVALGESVELVLSSPLGTAPAWDVDGVALGDGDIGTLAVQADPRVVVYSAPSNPSILPPASHVVTATIGDARGAALLSLVYPVPTIASLMPDTIDVGTSTTSLFVTGTGFSAGSQAEIDGVPARLQYLSPTRVDVDAPTARLRNSGQARLRVRNPLPGGGEAMSSFLIVLRQVTVPVGLDPSVPGLFAAATVANDPARRPAITYPEPSSVGPRDFAAPVVSWTQPAPLNVCRLRMSGPTSALDVYTSTAPRAAFQNPQATVPPNVWIPVLQGLPRPATFDLEVTCAQVQRPAGQPVRLAGNLVHRSASQAYVVSAESATGRIVYFSGSISGLARIDIRPDIAPPEAWIGPGPGFVTDSQRCVGCHSFSQSGTRMAHVAIGPFQAYLGAYDILGSVPTSRFQGVTTGVAEWVAMHPSGSFILAQNAAATLNVHDASGNFVMQVPTTTAARAMTQPAWAGDGAHIAFTGTNVPQTFGNESVQGGSIYVMSYANIGGTHTFGPARRVAGPAAMGGNAYYPSFSPDGQWVVLCRAPGGESYNNAGGRLWLVRTDGTVGPILLSRASQTLPNNTNSWPRWSPVTSGGRYYLMFSSVRDYPPLNGTGPTQLWVSQIDTNQLPGDPSSPAIWMSGQDPFTINLAAEWTQAF